MTEINPWEEVITWKPVEPIDEETSILVCTSDGGVGEAHMVNLDWYWTSDHELACPITTLVVRMADMPLGPPLP